MQLLVIMLSLISFCLGGPSGFTTDQRLSNGDHLILAKGAGLKNGMVASYSTLKHPSKDLKVIITQATDGRETLVKNVYDSHGEMIDCNVQVNEEESRKFLHEVDEQMRMGSTSHMVNHAQSGPMDDLQLSVALQAERCEQLLQRVAMEKVGGMQSVEMEEEEEQAPGRRQKRSYLIWPGTNWCGKGSKAEFAQSYGEHAEADQCCQKHDQCPYIIEGFTTKYNLFNYRIHTLSDCACDKKFLECLKSANTSTATMVGKVYFNVVNTECFDLKLQKTCAKRSWWGGCEKYTTKWTATVRSMGNYPE